MADPIRITPGGFQSAKPAHLIGAKGAAPYVTTPNIYDGFQNLIDLNGDVAWPVLNGATDEKATNGVATLFLGGNTKAVGDNVDVAVQNLLAWIVDVPIETGVGNPSVQKLNVNGEITTGAAGGTNGTHYGSYGQVFTTAGTVTVTAASPVIVGAGSTWTTDILAANYAVPAANYSRNLIEPGDIIAVGAAGSRIYFRIVAITDDTHLVVFPTPTAGNPAIGAGKAYSIIRTGYGSWSRIETIIVGTTDALYGYYAGNSGLSIPNGHKPGTFEAVAIFNPTSVGPAAEHYMAPKTVDSAGVTTGVDVQADDIIFYKGFMLYGAGSAISWTVGNFPSAVPFGPTDFPAKNIEVINRTGRFVTFERNGDQIIAIFEDNQYLVTATGAVPEFAFYKLPELLSVIHAARAEPCGINGGLAFGRPSCSGRGSIFYISNRGLENSSGGLAEESSRVVCDAIITICGTDPYFLSWDDAFDMVFVRRAFGGPTLAFEGQTNVALVYVLATQSWSTVKLKQVTGAGVTAVTAGVSPKTQLNDEIRLLHLGYYEVLTASGVPGTDGGDIRHLTTGLDRAAQRTGLVPWIWNTPVVPLGLEYPDFNFDGFIFDSYTQGASTPPKVTWTLYSGSSPYNMVARTPATDLVYGTAPVRKSSWTSSLDRQGNKQDLAFMQLRFTSFEWVQPAGVILFDSKTQPKR